MAERAVAPEVLVVGGGLGGVAAALSACAAGRTVLIADEFRWLGGQATSQAVPLDEHRWIERTGSSATYRAFRRGLRAEFRRTYPLRTAVRDDPALNPGSAWVSPLSIEPRLAVRVIEAMLRPWIARGVLRVERESSIADAEVDGDRIAAVTLRLRDGDLLRVEPRMVVEASETGTLLEAAGVEHRRGAESAAMTGEPHAPARALPERMQAATHCLAVEHVAGEWTIDRPEDYDSWRALRIPGWPGPMLDWRYPNPRTGATMTARFTPNPDEADSDMEAAVFRPELWTYRRVFDRHHLVGDHHGVSDVTVLNWPMNDYVAGPIDDVDAGRHRAAAKSLTLSLLYWLQTEAPRPDGGAGWPGLRPRPDVTGTDDGLAQAPYVREARRIDALATPREQDLSVQVRGDRGAVVYPDAVALGHYRIDLHPAVDGTGYVDIATHPFTVPLGALIPVRVANLVAAGKTIGATHITNGCYRVHPVEWVTGEIAGLLAAEAIQRDRPPAAIRADPAGFESFRRLVAARGVDQAWGATELADARRLFGHDG
ncbi:FAD-dependent oxidoreductase [Pseudolysinimonas kribbensis]|uniref:FAD-dependent oxidoreductase n=1 Tax=Pseudolysinimonas kribbensis TaxID=433641 RepID=UPI0031E10F17